MKKLILLLTLTLGLFAKDLLVFNNEYQILLLQKKVKKIIIGNKEMINVSVLDDNTPGQTLLKIFGKKVGNTSILILYRDSSIENYHVYINENLGFIQKMVNMIEPSIHLSKIGDGSTVISGRFKNPHDKKRIFDILQSAGLNLSRIMDLTQTQKVNKMVRTKLYLVEINNQKAKDLGGVTGLGFFNEYLKASANPLAINGATFSGFLLDHTGEFTQKTGKSVVGTLNFLETKGIAKILDDTVLITTEDKNATFRVGGEVYIPIGLTQNIGTLPTIQLEEKEYGLKLVLTSHFMEQKEYMHIDINIQDSEFDTNKEHDVQLGENTFVPSFVSKNMRTNVVVKSGQVIALGGRLHNETADRVEKVPLLGDIPLLGELFKHTVTANKNNDLIFFIVPEIVDANEDIDDTKFYRDTLMQSKDLHKQLLDMSPDMQVNKSPEPKIETEVKKQEIIEIETQTPPNDKKEKEGELTIEAKKDETPIAQAYAVNVEKIFLRSAPKNGKRVNVWKKGHKFIATEHQNIDNSEWLKISQNCYKDICKPVKDELWIAKKYTNEI
jgi:pilus assembly protein CpaC